MAFVTFNTERAAAECMNMVNGIRDKTETHSLSPAYFDSLHLSAERPPEPEEVYWEELQFSHSQLMQSQLAAAAIILVVALLGTAVIAAANYGMGPVMQTADSLWIHIGMQVLFARRCGSYRNLLVERREAVAAATRCDVWQPTRFSARR